MSINFQIVFYSMYGHTYTMAEAIAEGARGVDGVIVELLQVPELVPESVLASSGALQAREAFAHIPTATVPKLVQADAIVIGTPTRYGNMCGQMRNFLDQTGAMWAEGAFVGKVGSAFVSASTQHGGQESTLLSIYNNLFHFGLVVVGIPFSEQRLMISDEVTGGTPYGASTLAGSDGSRRPSETELEIAKTQGRHVATITKKLRS